MKNNSLKTLTVILLAAGALLAADTTPDRMKPLQSGVTVSFDLGKGESGYHQIALPAGEIKVVVDIRRRDGRSQEVLSARMTVVDGDGVPIQNLGFVMTDVDVERREVQYYRVKLPMTSDANPAVPGPPPPAEGFCFRPPRFSSPAPGWRGTPAFSCASRSGLCGCGCGANGRRCEQTWNSSPELRSREESLKSGGTCLRSKRPEGKRNSFHKQDTRIPRPARRSVQATNAVLSTPTCPRRIGKPTPAAV